MDAVGFEAWLDRQDLQPKTRADIMCDCKRVELWVGIDLNDLHHESDVHDLETGLLLIGIDSPKPQTVVRTLMWATRKYIQFRADTSTKTKGAGAGL